MPDADRFAFARRVLVAALVVLAVFGLVALVVRAMSVLLLAFGGVLLAVLLDGLATALARRTPLSRRAALAVVALALVGLLVGVGMLMGPALSGQARELQATLPGGLQELQAQLRRVPVLGLLADELGRAGAAGGGLARRLGGVFSSALSGLGAVAVVVFIGAHLAVDPGLYRRGVLHLVDRRNRARADAVLDALGRALRGFLTGQLVAMTIVGALTTVGLLIAGVPLAPLLGFIAFLLDFVPYVGPIAAAVPGLLVAFTAGPETALYAAAVYVLVQTVEGNLITPLVQQRIVHIAPALLIFMEVLFAALAGVLGVILSAPLAVAVVVLVQMLYVQDVIGDDVVVLGEKEGHGKSGKGGKSGESGKSGEGGGRGG